MNFKRKKIILTAGIFLFIAIAVSIIRFIPARDMHSENKGLPPGNVSTPTPDKIITPAANKPTATTTIKISSANPKHSAIPGDDVIPDEESPEGKVEREEGYKDDTPEKVQKRAALEKEIRTLTQSKAKEEKEMATLISSLDEAQKNSQLSPEELQKKQAEIKMIKIMLMRTYGERLSAIDSSLQEKLQQYRDMTTEKTESEGNADPE